MPDVCVVGSFMMDLVVRAERRPAAGETLIGKSFEMFLGGKGFNQAIAAARSGASTAMVGALGDDDFGAQFRACLDEAGIDAAAVRTIAANGTGVGMPLVEDTGENSIVVIPRANHDLTVDDIAAVADARVVLLQMELPIPVVEAAARAARQSGATVILNPAPAVAGLEGFKGNVDYVIPNTSEAKQLTGIDCRGEGAAKAAQAIVETTGARGVVVTLAERGALVVENAAIELVEGHSVTAVDTVGAGDAFCGALAAELAKGARLADAVAYGNAAGALAVQTPGAEPSMPTRAAVEQFRNSAS